MNQLYAHPSDLTQHETREGILATGALNVWAGGERGYGPSTVHRERDAVLNYQYVQKNANKSVPIP